MILAQIFGSFKGRNFWSQVLRYDCQETWNVKTSSRNKGYFYTAAIRLWSLWMRLSRSSRIGASIFNNSTSCSTYGRPVCGAVSPPHTNTRLYTRSSHTFWLCDLSKPGVGKLRLRGWIRPLGLLDRACQTCPNYIIYIYIFFLPFSLQWHPTKSPLNDIEKSMSILAF